MESGHKRQPNFDCKYFPPNAGSPFYLGRLGGERNGDGSYNMGLVYTRMSSRTTSRLLADVNPGTIRTGYASIRRGRHIPDTSI